MGKTFADVLKLISEYPAHIEVRMGWEVEEKSGGRFFYITLYERAPEGGWASQGAMYRSTNGAVHWKLKPHPASRYEDAVRVSVTAGIDDLDTCANLAYGMLEKYRGRYDVHPLTEETATTIEERMALKEVT